MSAAPVRHPETDETAPGHADLAGMQKYNFDDARDVLSEPRRETAGCRGRHFAKALLSSIGVAIVSHVTASAKSPRRVTDDLRDDSRRSTTRSPFFDPKAPRWFSRSSAPRWRLPRWDLESSLRRTGGPRQSVHWDRKLDGLLAGA